MAKTAREKRQLKKGQLKKTETEETAIGKLGNWKNQQQKMTG